MKERLNYYLKKKYYKDDKKGIVLHGDDESELYNKFDITGETIRDEVVDYLENNVETLLPLSEITIAIDSPKEVDLNRFKKALHFHYGICLLNETRIMKIIRKKCIYLLIAALVSLVLAAVLENIGREIFVFVGTLAIWELADFFVFSDEEDMILTYVYEVLQNAKIIKNDASKK